MKILVVGGGGREHALAWKLSQEAEVIAAPGNPGIGEDCELVPISAKEHDGLVGLCKARDIDLVVVGPEDPLIDGLADVLRGNGISVYGPNRDAAQLEGSKAFSKELMREAAVPTAQFGSFTDAREAIEFARKRTDAGKNVVIKASGNALGKGVVVTSSFDEAKDAIEEMLVGKRFGAAGETIVVEDRLGGAEFSVLTIVGDQNIVSLPIAQDHKRAFDGDQGPNTGGMGAFSPVGWVGSDLVSQVEETVVKPVIEALRARGASYRGTIFSGMMMDGESALCLEFNVRMGDPETQAVMMRLGEGYAEALLAAAAGEWIPAPEVLDNHAVTVVVAGGEYPVKSSKGAAIEIGPIPANAKLFHAGTSLLDGRLVTNGGRVFSATASAATLTEAKEGAYRAARAIRFEGARFRSDIATR